MRKILNKILNWIGIATTENLEVVKMNFKSINKSHEARVRSIIDSNIDAFNLELQRMENNFFVGADVDIKGTSFAIVCIAGKANIVRFIEFKSPYDAVEFLKRFNSQNVVVDSCNQIKEILKAEKQKI